MTATGVYLSVIVPAYNEAARITKTLRRISEYLASSPFSAEILVVLDGPTDATRERLQALVSEFDHLRMVDRHVNRGKGYSVREGMLQATGAIRLFTDADNSTDIAHFDQMKPLLDAGYDLVIASRNANDAATAEQSVAQPWYKIAIGQMGNRIVQTLAVPGIWDTQCGFKAFRADVAQRIFSQATIDRWGFDIEVLAMAQQLKYRIGIIPAHWINDARSHVKMTDYLKVLCDTVKVRRNLARGKYA